MSLSKNHNFSLFLQLLGIPLPAFVLAVLSAKFNFPLFEIWEGMLPMELPAFGVVAIFGGTLVIYSVDFLYDLKKWQRANISYPQWWSYVAYLWLVLGGMLAVVSCRQLVKDLDWSAAAIIQSSEQVTHYSILSLWKKIPNILILSGLVLYTIAILNEKPWGTWLKPILVSIVAATAVYYPQWLITDIIPFAIQSKFYVLMGLFLMNVWIMQAVDVSKDTLIESDNIWCKWPKIQSSLAFIVWLLTLLIACFWQGSFNLPSGMNPFGLFALMGIYGYLLLNASKLSRYPYARFIPDLALALLLVR